MNPKKPTNDVKPELIIRFGIAAVTPEVTFQIEPPVKRFPWHLVYHWAKEVLIWTAFIAFIAFNAFISSQNPHAYPTRVVTVPIFIHR